MHTGPKERCRNPRSGEMYQVVPHFICMHTPCLNIHVYVCGCIWFKEQGNVRLAQKDRELLV